MASRKKKSVSKVISVRVTDDELETIRAIMKTSHKTASNVLREAIRVIVAPAY
jgi:predicted DNA-binding protein